MSDAVSQALAATEQLTVHQAKEWGEILTGFETKNRYVIRDAAGNDALLAAEQSSGLMATLLRVWLKAMRPFTMAIMTPAGQTVMMLKRPFRFIFHRLEITGPGGEPIGAVQKRWSWIRRIYDVQDAQGQVLFRLFGPMLKPWTFDVQKGDQTVGAIRKKWSGMLKEAFTDADNFGVELGPSLASNERTLLLGAVFLIDFVHFENRN